MKSFVRTLAAALVLSAGASHAAVIDFNDPALIDIDNATSVATYREAGFALAGDAASFLQLDGIGTGMSGALALFAGSTVSLSADNGGLFSFSGFDGGSFDGMTPATLNLTAVFGNNSQSSFSLDLAMLGSQSFSALSGLSELRLSASSDLVVDNLMVDVSPVPEPASVAMLLLGVGTLLGVRGVARRKAAL
jgi:hypothetical protein